MRHRRPARRRPGRSQSIRHRRKRNRWFNSPPASNATTTPDAPPIIQINGDNPAIIHVRDSYNDLGATISGPQADLNLGITTYANGTVMSPAQIDTTQAATDTIEYVVIDSAGLTATSTRTVIIQAAPSIVPTDASTTASTEASCTAQ